ncbi:MAG: S9 family peptidase [Pseudomonadota bacterium]
MSLSTAIVADDKIPAREFFERSLVKTMKISPDGEHAALTFEEGTEVKLAIMNLDTEEVIQGFEYGDFMHVLDFWWGSNERIVMAVGEVTGNLDTNTGRPSYWYASNIDGRRRDQIFDSGGNQFYQMLHPLPEDEDHVLVSSRHFADDFRPKAHLLDMVSGELDFIGNQPVDPDLAALIADNDGVVRAGLAFEAGESLDDGELRLHIRDSENDEWEELTFDSARRSPDMAFLGFSANNRVAYFASDHDMAMNGRRGVFMYNFDTDEMELVFRDPYVDVGGLFTGPGGKILGAYSRQAEMQYSLFDHSIATSEQATRLKQSVLASFPDQDVMITSSSDDGTRNIVYARSDRNPGQFYLFDTEEMQMQFLIEAMPNLPKDRLVPMEPIVVTARDGMELHGFLTRPAEQKEGLPLIVNVHGGPFGPWDDWSYNMEAQFFAHHGYATLQINFRGSGNRGMDFQRAGWRQWGGKMQDDVTDATQWAIEQGIADANRVCIYGGSYGGYATLMGVVKEPELYQCGVGYVGVYDLTWFRDGDGSDFSRGSSRLQRENFERFMFSAVGENPESLRPYSPLHHVDKIKADLFIVHGAADVRVPVGHAYRLREALDEIGKPYEWMIKEKEGHGFYDVDNRVELYTSMLEFFDKHIGPDAETAHVVVESELQLASQH